MPLYETGPVTQWTAVNAGIVPSEVFGVAINYFVNRTPLLTRLPKVPVGSPNFLITNDNYRPRTTTVGATPVLAGDGTITFTDGSVFDTGDTLLIDNEYLQVTSIAANVVTVVRAFAGSVAAGHAAGASTLIVTNARTGAEVLVSSVSRIPQAITQFCQTVQHAYQVGGALQADTTWTAGFPSPMDRDRMLAMQHVVDDFESACYYGAGVQLASATTRPNMFGLQKLIVTNKVTVPINAAAYKPSDLERDTIQAAFNGGGNPSVLIVSTNFMTGMSIWGHAALRLEAGATEYGTPINVFEAPFLQGITIVPAPLLQPGTVICLSLPEVRIRLKRPMIDKPRGSRGDAFEGDIILEGAIELDNEAHSAWVSGITGFAAA